MIWRVLERAVHRKKPRTKDKLIEACVEAWTAMTPTKIEIAYRLLPVVMRQSISHGGGQQF